MHRKRGLPGSALVLSLLLAGCYPGARVDLGPGGSEPVRVPMLVDPRAPARPIVEASLGGLDVPVLLAIDTAMPASWLDPLPLRAAGVASAFIPNFHGWRMPFRGARADVRVGGARFPGHSWWVLDADEPLWRDLAGGIGPDVLRNLDVVLDYAEGTVSFYPAGRAPATGVPVRIRFPGVGYPEALLTVPGLAPVWATLSTTAGETRIRGGVHGPVGHPRRIHRRSSTTTMAEGRVGSETRSLSVVSGRIARAEGATLGPVRLSTFDVVLRPNPFDDWLYASWGGAGDALLGAEELLGFRVTLSIRRKTVWLEERRAPLARRKTVAERMLEIGTALGPADERGMLLMGIGLPRMKRGLEAERALEALVERVPAEGGYGLRFAEVARWRGDFATAEARARRVLVDSGAYAPAELLVAEMLLWQGRLDDAITVAESVIRAGGGTGDWNRAFLAAPRRKWVLEAAYTLKAHALLLRGDLTESIPVVRDALDAVGDYLPARWLLGRIFLARGEPALAADQIELLLDEARADPAEIMDLYAAAGRLADLEPVLAGLRDVEASTGWPGRWDQVLGDLYAELGAAARARDAHALALATEPHSLEDRIAHARFFAKAGRFDEAIARLEALRREQLRRAALVEVALATVLTEAGRYAEAVTVAEAARAGAPWSVEALRAQLLPLRRLGRHEEALAVLGALATFQDDQRVEWLLALHASGREAEAAAVAKAEIAHARAALFLSPASPGARCRLALDLAWSRGDLVEARKLAEEAVAARPRAALPWLALAEVHLAAGDTSAARVALRRAAEVDPVNEWGAWLSAKVAELDVSRR